MRTSDKWQLLLVVCLPLLGQNQVSWVSSSGSDNDPCTRVRPCRTFQVAHDHTNAGGIVRAVNAGEYGPITITKAITVDGSNLATIAAAIPADHAAISIQAPIGGSGTSAGIVALRNLTLNLNGGPLTTGIGAGAATTLVENVAITGAVGNAVGVGFGAPITIRNVTISGASYGVFVQGGTAMISESVFRGCSNGISVNSDGLGHAGIGFIERSEISANIGIGLAVSAANGSPAIVRFASTVITGNGTGILATSGGQILSFGNNMIAGNTIDGSPSTNISLQ